MNKLIRTILPDGSKGRKFAGRAKKKVLDLGSSNYRSQKIKNSKLQLRRVADNLLPKDTGRRKVVQKLYSFTKGAMKISQPIAMSYKEWINIGESHVWVKPHSYAHEPLISIVVPVYNTPDKYLLPLLKSVYNQLYTNWQLCIADGSTHKERAKAIKASCSGDDRVIYKRLKTNYGIVGNTNEALGLATGEFISFLDHDDTLSTHALLEVVDAINRQPGVDLLYSDEDKISDNGKVRSQPYFKPDWSPTLLEGVNYITHFLTVRHNLLKKVGGLREGFNGSQDYDLVLRVTDMTKNIVHIPKILYHWRLANGSTSGSIGNKDYADRAGQAALRDHIERKGIKANVIGIPERPTNYRLQYEVPKGAKASIIIPFKDKVELLKTCLPSILDRTAYSNYEVILISNNSVEKRTHEYLATLKNEPKVKIFYYNKPFNYSAINNFGRKQASGNYLVLLNNDTEVISGEWLGELIGVAAQKGIGAVGPLLLYPNNKIQHAGIILGMDTMAGLVFRKLRDDVLTPFGRPYWPRNYLAVIGACLVVSTSKYDEVGGLDEQLKTCGNDVAFCLRLHEVGYLNVYWPFVRLYHYENQSVGSYKYSPTAQADYDRSLIYYKPYLNWRDPYFNPNLDLMNEQIALRRNYEEAH